MFVLHPRQSQFNVLPEFLSHGMCMVPASQNAFGKKCYSNFMFDSNINIGTKKVMWQATEGESRRESTWHRNQRSSVRQEFDFLCTLFQSQFK